MAAITSTRRHGFGASAAGRLGSNPAAPWRHLDVALIGTVLAIAGIGVLMVYSATRGPGGDFGTYETTFLKRQALFAGIGVGLMLLTASIDYRRYRDFAPVAYLGTCALLALVVSPIGTESKGTQAWFQLGPFQLQPSEFAKLALILGLAAVVAQFRDELDLRRLGATLIVVGVPLGLIMLQPDLGTGLVLVSIAAGVLLVGGAQPKHLVALVVVGTLGVAVVLNSDLLADYQRDRLTTFLNQSDGDLRGEAYNLDQSKIAIGAGGPFGRGLFNGTQTRLDNVPEQHTDFIFTAVGEELGFVGAGTLLALFAILAWRIWRTAQLARDDFGSLVCVGVLCMLLFQIFENIGMTMGIMPITGITLPFVSYGGSSILASFVAVGLVLNVHSRRFS